MFTQREKNTINLVYSSTSCKYLGLPLRWESGKMSLKFNFPSRLCHKIKCIILLLIIIIRLKQIPMLIQKRDINANIFQIIFIGRYFFHWIFRTNTWIFQVELVQLINQSLNINSSWGKYKTAP